MAALVTTLEKKDAVNTVVMMMKQLPSSAELSMPDASNITAATNNNNNQHHHHQHQLIIANSQQRTETAAIEHRANGLKNFSSSSLATSSSPSRAQNPKPNNSMSSKITTGNGEKYQLAVNRHRQSNHHHHSNSNSNLNNKLLNGKESTFNNDNNNNVNNKTSVNSLCNFKEYISESSKNKIADIIADIEKFNDIEKLYLYLQLPDGGGSNTTDDNNNDGKKKVLSTPFGKKADSEVIQTYAWIRSHLEEDISVSIPKHEVYEEYKAFCEANKFEKLCVADFGKAMKQIFPHVKPRRLGQRGNSKYCYSGLMKKMLLNAPELPIIDTSEYQFSNDEQDNNHLKSNVMVNDIVWNIILEWVEKTFNRKFKSSIDFARYLIETQNIKTNLAKSLPTTGTGENWTVQPTKFVANPKAASGNSVKAHQQSNNKKTFEKTPRKCDSKNSNRSNNNNNNGSKATDGLEINDQRNGTSTPKNGLAKIETSSPKMETNLMVPGGNSKTFKIWLGNQTPVAATYVDPQILVNGGNRAAESNAFKYKPIQPKPVSLESDPGSNSIPKNVDNGSPKLLINPISVKKECDEHDSKHFNENDKNYKRQIDEKEFEFMNKKRHVENNIPTSGLEAPYRTDGKLESISDLKVNDLENEALNEYLNNTNNTGFVDDCQTGYNGVNSTATKDNFVQIRQLLENHLAKAPGNQMGSHYPQPGPIGNNIDSKQSCPSSNHNSNSTLQSLLANFGSKDVPVMKMAGKKPAFSGASTVAGNHAQISPSARQNAFIFQPISPRSTPTIPENSVIDVNNCSSGPMYKTNGHNNSNGITCNNGSVNKQMASVSVGPSQPGSEANSPFVSPRHTPISFSGCGSRSRNNSGQSAYSAYRQTPLQNFDSGVSSISSSPFISPQSTPIPSTRTAGPPNITPRVRHSSGPTGPVNRNGGSLTAGLMAYNRSNSLSPMIASENCFSNQNYPQQSLGLNSALLKDDNLGQKLSVVTQTDHQTKEANVANADSGFFFNFQTDPALNMNNQHQKSARQRHFSNPYGGVSTMVKNDDDNDFKMLLNRSQSVPLHQMFESNIFEPESQLFQFNVLGQNSDTSGPLMMPMLDQDGTSKSYPSTPICNQNLPNSTGNSGTSSTGDGSSSSGLTMNDMMTRTLDDLLTSNDNVIQSGQDLIVSSVHLNPGVVQDSTNDSNQPTAIDDLNVPSPLIIKDDDRNGFNDLLIHDTDVEQFQSLDAFQDCDNDFTNIDLGNTVNAYDGDFSV